MDFKQFYKTVQFDIDKEIRTVLQATQGDTKSRGLLVPVVVNSVVTPITTETMNFFALKPDGTRVMTAGVKDGDKFRIDFTNQTFSVAGTLLCALVLYGTNGEKIADKKFKMTVDSSLEDGAIISEDERGILDRAFDLASDIVPRLEGLDVPLLENLEQEVTLARGTEPTLGDRLDESEITITVDNGANYSWVLGIVPNDGSAWLVESQSRLSVNQYIPVKKGDIVSMTVEEFEFYIVEYDASNQFINGGTYGESSITITDPSTKFIRATIRRKDQANFSDADVTNVPFVFTIKRKVGLNTYANREFFIQEKEKTGIEWEPGSINGSGENFNSSTRIRTQKHIHVGKGEITFIGSEQYEMLVIFYENDAFKYRIDWTKTQKITLEEPAVFRVVLRKISQEPILNNEIQGIAESINISYFQLSDSVVPEIASSDSNSYAIKIGGVGQLDAGITKGDDAEYTLAAVKHIVNRKSFKDSINPNTPQLPIGYLYHSSPVSNSKKLYYSAAQADKPKQIGELEFDPYNYQSAIGEDGEIIWVHNGNRTTPAKVHNTGDYNVSQSVQTDITPIAWLQNNGIDFAKDANGEEYCIFGEYTGARLGDLYLWKVTKPYSDPANWKRVLTQTQTTNNRTSDGDVWHFHTVNHDPYNNVWYATSGDTESSCKWWYSTDEGETWTLLLQGDTIGWEAQIARLIGFVFTEDYVYWGNDYGTNHSLNRVSRGSDGVIDPMTRVKLAELNKNQSTYATVLMHSPPGILTLDRVDTAFGSKTDKLDIEFWSFEDEKLYTLKTLKRVSEKPNSFFGFRCKTYTLYQGIYDTRIVVGFGTSPNWFDIPYNDTERRSTLILDIY